MMATTNNNIIGKSSIELALVGLGVGANDDGAVVGTSDGFTDGADDGNAASVEI